ncbi:hypothetical protein CKM354_001134600 [Cercospora kikuchii]|uniref:Zn(2)-C6 fungal-type domain-containing protein n=1 Tax=Cercospora kikuchii TaxID=84275 RepID=A0A9P3CST3_9PEZI|nr:uncharacterized protein CKM354_001134600 [Cercospora kikuchii]GIZ48278.1 hypothetical protein CKM354_001134600 [Cercospora kikuchii]
MSSPAKITKTSRPRAPRSCIPCGKRKVGCDKERPNCGRCARAGIACTYAAARSPPAALTMIDETPSLASRASRLYELTHAAPVADIPILPPSSTTRSDRSPPTENGPFCAPTPPSPCRDGTTPTRDTGHLYVGPHTKGHYISSAHFALISQEVAAINDLLRDQKGYTRGGPPDSMRGPLGQTFPASPPLTATKLDSNGSSVVSTPHELPERELYGDLFPNIPAWNPQDNTLLQSQTPSIDEILAGLPTKEQSEVLIWSYMGGYHAKRSLFHGPSFLVQVRKFQHWYDTRDPNYQLSVHFLSLLTAVLFAGSVVCPRFRLQTVFGNISRETLTSRLYRRAVRAIRLSEFPQSPSLQSLSAFIIVDSTWLREEQPLTCCSFIGVATRVAQMLGLHREPTTFGHFSNVDVHIRRQIWWSIVSIDAQVAFASGLPPILDCRLYNVLPVSEISAAAIREDFESHGNANKSVLGIFIGGRFAFYKRGNEILHLLHSSLLSEKDLDRILEITRAIKEDMDSRTEQIHLIEKMTTTSGPCDGTDIGALRQTESNAALAQFAKMLFALWAAKPYSVMYGPMRRQGLLPALRKKQPGVIVYCREYVHRFLRLAERRDFQPWHWCWPGQHQPLHSIMALITDLEDHPNDPEAVETRKLVDLAIYKCIGSDDCGIVSHEDGNPDPRPLHPGGTQAWRFLRRARDRAWEMAGLDPSILTCPESVHDIRLKGVPDEDRDAQDQPDEWQDYAYGPIPQTYAEWSYLGQATDPNFGFMNELELQFPPPTASAGTHPGVPGGAVGC